MVAEKDAKVHTPGAPSRWLHMPFLRQESDCGELYYTSTRHVLTKPWISNLFVLGVWLLVER